MNDQERMLADMYAAGASAEEIGRRIGIGRDAVYKWVRRLGIEKRARKFAALTPDPTLEEIAERAREQRELHYAKRRGESNDDTRKRVWREERDRLRA